ncbi:hypothetical protein C0989_000849 [Termitomyces sp. Mn162]|nr:hypothetical protein C0989_000849 [Termitomyces sp. Mn162]
MLCLPQGQEHLSANYLLGPCPPAQLNATDIHKALEPLDASPNDSQDLDNALDSADNQEALCANKIQNQPWIYILEETQEKQQKEGACILCSEQGHFIDQSPLMSHSTSIPKELTFPKLSHSSVQSLHDHSSSAFKSMTFQCNFNKLLELQLFDKSPASTKITQYYNNALTLNNNLRFQVWLLVTQLPKSLIVLGLPWLQNINPNINWKNLTMQFSGPKASLAAAIPLCIQSPSDPDIPDLDASTSKATQSSSILKDD